MGVGPAAGSAAGKSANVKCSSVSLNRIGAVHGTNQGRGHKGGVLTAGRGRRKAV